MMVVNKLFFFLLTTTFLVGNAVAGNGEDNAHTSRVPAKRCAVVGSSVYEVTNNAEIIGAKALHAKGIRGQGTKAIVVDTYVDSTHEALIGRLSESTVAGNARIDSENASEAQRHQNRKHNQHGTHVTGIAAEIAPDATIKFIANSLNPVIALEDAAKSRGDAVNVSYVLPDSKAVEEALEKIVNSGKVIFIALGNDYATNTTKARTYAARIKGIAAKPNMKGMIVPVENAMYDHSGKERLAPTSNRVEENCPHTLVLPGCDILSPVPGDEYAVLSGTSMAAPAATAGYLLLKSAHPELTPQEILGLMRGTARKRSLNNSYVFSEEYANGVPNLLEAWEKGNTTKDDSVVLNTAAPSQGPAKQLEANVQLGSADTPIEITYDHLEDEFSLDKLKELNQAPGEVLPSQLEDEFSLDKLKELNQAPGEVLPSQLEDEFSLDKLKELNQAPVINKRHETAAHHPSTPPSMGRQILETVNNFVVEPIKNVFTAVKNTVTRFTGWVWN